MPSSHLILCRSPSPPALNPSQHQSLFQWSTLRMRWPKYWSFSFSIIPSKQHSVLISFRMDWLDLLAVVLGKTNLEVTQSIKQRFSNLYAKLLGKLANIQIPWAFSPVDLGPRNWHFNKQHKIILMKVSMLVKLENKEHNLAAVFLNLGSASDHLRSLKKNLDVSPCLPSWGTDKTH